MIKSIILIILTSYVYSFDKPIGDHIPYGINDNQFIIKEGKIPPECLANFLVQLNGDDVVSSIFLSRVNLNRGCIDANIQYLDMPESKVTYKILDKLGSNKYRIYICEAVNGSLGRNCSDIAIEFKIKKYLPSNKKVFILEKIGEF